MLKARSWWNIKPDTTHINIFNMLRHAFHCIELRKSPVSLIFVYSQRYWMLTMKFCDVKDKRTSELAGKKIDARALTHYSTMPYPKSRWLFPNIYLQFSIKPSTDVRSRSIDITLPAYWHRRSHSSRNSNKYRTSNKKTICHAMGMLPHDRVL